MKKISSLITTFLLLHLIPAMAVWGSDVDGEPRSGTSLLLSASGGALTVDIKAVPLSKVLEELSRQAAITVQVEPSSAETEVWDEFQDLPLEQAIRRLLQGQSYVLIYPDTPSASEKGVISNPAEIRVLRSGAVREPSKKAVVTIAGGTRQADKLQTSTLDQFRTADTEARVLGILE